MAKITWYYDVTDSATSTALAGVYVWVSSDDGGKTVLDTATTDAAGQATLSLEQDTDVYIWTAYPGYTPDANPDRETVTDGVDGAGTMTAIVAAVPDAVVQADTVLNLIEDALRECGILGQGESAEAADSQDALRMLNYMIEQWRLKRRYVYKLDIDRYTLTADLNPHTIGPSGTFSTARPTKIVEANIVITNADPTVEEYRYPLSICETALEWAKISNQDLTSDIPSVLYCDYAWPNANLYLWAVPGTAYDLELVTRNQIAKFRLLTEVVSLPEGYYPALMLSLAEKLSESFGVPTDKAMRIAGKASEARKIIGDHNQIAPRINLNDSGIPQVTSL